MAYLHYNFEVGDASIPIPPTNYTYVQSYPTFLVGTSTSRKPVITTVYCKGILLFVMNLWYTYITIILHSVLLYTTIKYE